MKTYPSLLLLAAALLASGCQTIPANPNPATAGDITVNFQDQDRFTDVRESSNGSPSEYYLSEIAKYVQETAAKRMTAGQKLSVTFTDIDLAGDIRPGQINDVRIVKEIYLPRMNLQFKLTDASGTVLKEGEKRLSDLNFQQSITPITRNDPLIYDKALLDSWIRQEFSW